MNKKEDYLKMIEILKSLGISMEVAGCGCCDSPVVSFSYKGEKILKDCDNCNFSTDEEPEETWYWNEKA